MSWLLIVGLKNALLVVPLAVAAVAAGRCFRRPALAHVLWVLVLVKLLTPPLVNVPVGWSIDLGPWLTEIVPGAPQADQSIPHEPPALALDSALAACDSPAAASAPLADSQPFECPADDPAVAAPQSARATSWLPAWMHLPRSAADWLAIVGCIWLCGSSVGAALMLQRAVRFRRFLRLAARDDHRLLGRVRQLAYGVGLIRPPAVVVVEGVVSPMLWGLGSRVQLVFPARLAERLSPGEIDALLLHELAHYARGDHWVRLVELLAHVAYWWHPVVWWARREIESAEEQCCDAWVVEHQRGSRRSYAEALLATIDFLCEPATPLPPAACGLGDVPLLRCRLTQIMRGELGGQLPRTVWVAVLGAGLVLSPLEPAVFATSSRARLDRTLPVSWIEPAAIINVDDLELPAAESIDQPPSETSRSAAAPLPPPTMPLPTDARPVSLLIASAQSPNGDYRLEARTGRQATLSHRDGSFRVGLASYRFTCAAFAPDSRSFLTGHEDGQVKLWDSMTGASLVTLRPGRSPIASVGFSPTGRQIAAGALDGTVTIWDVAAQNEIARLPNPQIAVSCLRWSPDGSRLAVALGNWSGTDDARLVVWSLEDDGAITEQSLAHPLGALDWLSADALLVADWKGDASVRHLNGDRLSDGHGLELRLRLDKNLVSAAHWSPDCRLVSAWDAQQLLSGTAR